MASISTRATFLLAALLAGAASIAQSQATRIVNDNYGFALTLPASWTMQRMRMADPLPDRAESKSDKVELKGSMDTGATEPADWNALQLNSGQAYLEDGSLEFPQITVYAHPHAPLTFEQWSKELGTWLTMFGLKVMHAQELKTAAGVSVYDYVYMMGSMPVRLAMVYGNGVRYGFMFVGTDSASVLKHGPAFEKFVTAIELIPAKAPAAVH